MKPPMNQQTNNNLDDQFMTVLQEEFPINKKAALKAKLSQIPPEKRWWEVLGFGRGGTMMPRLAGVMALGVVGCVGVWLINSAAPPDATETMIMIDSAESQEEPVPTKEVIPPPNLDEREIPAVVEVLGTTYRWDADSDFDIPTGLPAYALTLPEMDTADLRALAETMNVTDPQYTAWQNTSHGQTRSFEIISGRSGQELTLVDDFVYFTDHTVKQNLQLNVPASELYAPMADTKGFEHVKQFIDANVLLGDASQYTFVSDNSFNGKTDIRSVLDFSSNNQVWFSPQLIVPDYETPIPIYDSNLFSLFQASLGSDGRVIHSAWRPFTLRETDDALSLMPPLDALDAPSRHHSSFTMPDIESYKNAITPLHLAQDGDIVSVRGFTEDIRYDGENKASIAIRSDYSLKITDNIKEDMRENLNGQSNVIMTGRIAIDPDRTQYEIDVQSWKIDSSRCTSPPSNRDFNSPVVITSPLPDREEVTIASWPKEVTRVSWSNEVTRGGINVCADDWQSEPVIWHSIDVTRNIDDILFGMDTPDYERTISNVSLVLALSERADDSQEHTLTPYWQLTGHNPIGEPFTLYVRADA